MLIRISSEKLSGFKKQVFKNRAQAERRAESQCAEYQNDTDQKRREERRIHWKGSGRWRNALLLREIPRQRDDRNYHEEPSDEHVPSHRDVVPPVRSKSCESRAVVPGSRREGVQDFRQAMGTVFR